MPETRPDPAPDPAAAAAGLSLPMAEALDRLEQGFAVFDAGMRMLACNRRFLELHDLPPAMAFPGALYLDFVRLFAARGDYGPGDPETLAQARVARAAAGERLQIDLMKPEGRVIEALGSALPGGGYLSTCADVTERRAREEFLNARIEERTRALKASEARLALIADEVPAGIAHLDHALRILYANRRFARAYRKTPAEVIGLYAPDLLHPRTIALSQPYFERSRRGAPVDFEMRLELPGGRFKDVRTFLRPDSPSQGALTGFYLLSVDITRRKAAMAALMGAQKMDALGRMASGISHDFNNLLTIILGNLLPLADELAPREDGAELVREYITPAIAAARRGSALTQRLLTLARREQFDPVATDIVEAVEEICALLRSTLPKKLTLAFSARTPVPQALVDRAQLEMALLNLAMNARDATGGEGQITIEIAPHELTGTEADLLHLPQGRYLRLSFADDGAGMGPDEVERIFEPFFTTKAAGAGSGLGLSMVYGFIKQSNGAISVESAPGAGCCFTILLPGAALRRPEAPRLPAPPRGHPAPDPTETTGRPLVLLVEDDRDLRRTLRRRIAALGYPLLEAETAQAAQDLAAQVPGIGIVLSDIDMPGPTNGIDLARWLRECRPELRVVLMSGLADLVAEAQTIAGVRLLRKPFAQNALIAALGAGPEAP